MEKWLCLDCLQVGPLNRKGQCGTCGSEAVTESEGRSAWKEQTIGIIGNGRMAQSAAEKGNLRLLSFANARAAEKNKLHLSGTASSKKRQAITPEKSTTGDVR